MDLYLMLGIGAAIAGYLLSYIAYHYIETRDAEKDDLPSKYCPQEIQVKGVSW